MLLIVRPALSVTRKLPTERSYDQLELRYPSGNCSFCEEPGRPKPPQITDPLDLILFENVAYLANDEKRAAAFAALKKKIGTRPERILKASQKQLEEITRMGGIVPELRAQRLRQIADSFTTFSRTTSRAN